MRLLRIPDAIITNLRALANTAIGDGVTGQERTFLQMTVDTSQQVLSLPDADESQAVALTCRALADPSSRVPRAALKALDRGRVSLTAAELLELSRREPRAALPVLDALATFDAFTRAATSLGIFDAAMPHCSWRDV